MASSSVAALPKWITYVSASTLIYVLILSSLFILFTAHAAVVVFIRCSCNVTNLVYILFLYTTPHSPIFPLIGGYSFLHSAAVHPHSPPSAAEQTKTWQCAEQVKSAFRSHLKFQFQVCLACRSSRETIHPPSTSCSLAQCNLHTNYGAKLSWLCHFLLLLHYCHRVSQWVRRTPTALDISIRVLSIDVCSSGIKKVCWCPS